MNRREWMKVATLAGAAVACEPHAGSAEAYMDRDGCQVQTSITRLKLRHTWTTTMSSSEYRDTLSLRLV
ncbi:MAG: dipeptide epimerase, partial [Acidobacteria bacterium]